MKKKIVAVVLSFILFVILILFAIYMTQESSRSDSVDTFGPEVELGGVYDENEKVYVGKILRNTAVNSIDYSFNGFSGITKYRKYEALMQVILRVKGDAEVSSLRFEYFGRELQYGRYSNLDVGDTILYTPKRNKDMSKDKLQSDSYILLSSASGALVTGLWYDDTSFKKGADVLKRLGYKAYDEKSAIDIFNRFYSSSIADDIAMTVAPAPTKWIVKGKCRKLFGWGCAQKDFCYTISSFSGSLVKCNEYTRSTISFPDR